MNVPQGYEGAKNEAFLSLLEPPGPPSAARPSSPVRNSISKKLIDFKKLVHDFLDFIEGLGFYSFAASEL